MTDVDWCARADEFFDGELDAASEAAFRAHFPECAGCRERVFTVMMLDVVGQTAVEAQSTPRHNLAAAAPANVIPLRSRRRRAWWIAAGSVAAAAALILIWRAPWNEQPVQLALANERSIEPRLSWPAADRYRPRDTLRGETAAHETVPLEALARLQARHELRGVAAGEILAGELDRANELLSHEPRSADVLSDQAAIALLGGRPDRALALAAAALTLQPAHAQAQWNRALALRDLGLLRTAAAALDRLAARNEPGWSGEARTLAMTWRTEDAAREQAYRAAVANGQPPLVAEATAASARATQELAQHHVAAAEAAARDALARARRAGAWGQEREILRQLSEIARQAEQAALADAYAAEAAVAR